MSDVKISVIVPIYNSEQALPKCIESVLNQSFSDFELLLISDGSTDDSVSVCEQYAATDTRIRVFDNENKGVSYTRNFGIENAKGKYIMFLDSDDFVDKDWCRLNFEAIENNPTSWIVSGVRNVFPDGRVDDFLVKGVEKTALLKKDDYYLIFESGLSGFPVNRIYSKRVLADIRFDTSSSCGEDVVFNNLYLQKCDSIFVINELLYNYLRGDGETLSTRYDSKYFDVHRPLYESRKQFINDADMPAFCKTYFSIFTTGLKMTFDKRNKDGFFSKLKYNNYILKNLSFIECMNNADLSGESPKYIKLLRKQNYFKVYVVEKLAAFKKKLGK
ncbi:MAG: glycosyltransferase family 2 protein [Clostridia bacterium]|nr:glycosyltransferase family 2 protein [Clostridia bacterium]